MGSWASATAAEFDLAPGALLSDVITMQTRCLRADDQLLAVPSALRLGWWVPPEFWKKQGEMDEEERRGDVGQRLRLGALLLCRRLPSALSS